METAGKIGNEDKKNEERSGAGWEHFSEKDWILYLDEVYEEDEQEIEMPREDYLMWLETRQKHLLHCPTCQKKLQYLCQAEHYMDRIPGFLREEMKKRNGQDTLIRFPGAKDYEEPFVAAQRTLPPVANVAMQIGGQEEKQKPTLPKPKSPVAGKKQSVWEWIQKKLQKIFRKK